MMAGRKRFQEPVEPAESLMIYFGDDREAEAERLRRFGVRLRSS